MKMVRINLVNRLIKNGVVLPEDKPLIKRDRKEKREAKGMKDQESRGGEQRDEEVRWGGPVPL